MCPEMSYSLSGSCAKSNDIYSFHTSNDIYSFHTPDDTYFRAVDEKQLLISGRRCIFFVLNFIFKCDKIAFCTSFFDARKKRVYKITDNI